MALVVCAAVAVARTSRVFSGTVDEPAHVAAGMQWLSAGDYDYDLQHPPLGRIAAAIGPYLHGVRTVGRPGVFDEGEALLGDGTHYAATLASARHGELLFLLLLAGVVWGWARRLAGEIGGVVAVLFTVTNPVVLAHAGLATTDIACAATTTLALWCASRWADGPAPARASVAGAAIGLAIASRFSALAFVGGGLALAAVVALWSHGVAGRTPAERPRKVARSAALAAVACLIVLWASYRFAVGPVHPGGVALPAPALLLGIDRFLLHGSNGHPTFLLGQPGSRGWWYYFPIAFLVKTPLPLLLCAIVGTVTMAREVRRAGDWQGAVPLCGAAATLAVSMVVKVDLGIRLILPLYPLLAIVAAQGLREVWLERPARSTALLIGLASAAAMVVAARAYPDELSYFNALAGDHPERVLVDSNLDWGQDLYRLRDTLAARGITDSVRIAYFGTADPARAGVPRARLLGLHERTTGWVAASETYLAGEWVGRAYSWLLDYPAVARIGPSMRLWYIDPRSATTGSSPR